MQHYFRIGKYLIPSYGTMGLLGILLAVIMALSIGRREKWPIRQCVISGLVGLIGTIAGARIYHIAVGYFIMRNPIYGVWDLLDILLHGGYSFYGGLIGGLGLGILAAKGQGLPVKSIAGKLIFLIPLTHGIWKIGCLLGGCCYGIRYKGPFAITYPEGVEAPTGVLLFPAPLLEAVVLFGIALFLWVLSQKSNKEPGQEHTTVGGMHGLYLEHPVLVYLFLYGWSRLLTDMVRMHEGILSVAQVVSMLLIVISGVWMGIWKFYRGNHKKRRIYGPDENS